MADYVFRGKSIWERREDIRKAIKEGATSAEEISSKVGLKPETVRHYCRDGKIKIPAEKSRGELLEQRIEEVKTAIESRAKSVTEIVERTDLSRSQVYYIKRKYGIEVPHYRVYRMKKETLEELSSFVISPVQKGKQNAQKIDEAIAEGAKTVSEIACKTEISYSSIYFHLRKRGMIDNFCNRRTYNSLNRNSPITIEEIIRQALAKGVSSPEELQQETKYSLSTLKAACAKYKIKLPFVIPRTYNPKRRPDLDALIQQGLILQKIGDKVDLSRERIRQYVTGTGQYQEWKKKRKEYERAQKNNNEQLRAGQGIFLSVLKARKEQLAKEQSWAYQKAVEYCDSRKYKKAALSYIPFDTILKLFEAYEEAREKGHALSLGKLGKIAGIRFESEVGRILHRVGLETMCFRIEERQLIPPEKKEALKRAFYSDLSVSDVAYFMNLHYFNVDNNFHRIGKRNLIKPVIIGRPKFATGSIRFSCKTASQIYEALDLSFSKNEVMELYNLPEKAMDHLLEHCLEYEYRIMAALKLLYPNQEITKPYINWKSR